MNSGDSYQNLRRKGLIDDKTITIQVNTDGAQTFKSSKFGIWPLMGIINEANYKTRRSCILLLALWYGNKKPPRNTLLSRTIDQLNFLQNFGLTVDGIVYKVRVLIISTDTVARPLVRNSTGTSAAEFLPSSRRKCAERKRQRTSLSSTQVLPHF